MPKVRKAVMLAAGMGSRLLPATKSVPKEMVTIVDRPLIQYSVEEAVAAGIEHIIFVVAEGKESIREHFSTGGRIEALLEAKGDTALLEACRAAANLAEFSYVIQDQPRGQAHAVACARQFVEGEPFALYFPDDLIIGERPCIGSLIDAYEAIGGSVIAVETVPHDEVFQYGVVDPISTDNPMPIRGIVEKPPVDQAPSDYAIVGRYLLNEHIFEAIDATQPGKGGELWIADSLALQLQNGRPVYATTYEGLRFDTGRPSVLAVAQAGAALLRPDIGPGVRAALKDLMERIPA